MTMSDSPRAARASMKERAAAPRQDLRAWLSDLRAAGEVQEINGAEREREIGGIVDLYMRRMGNPAVLFDDIPGYPRGHRILANILTSVRRINLTLGLPIDGSAVELVSYWRRYMKEARGIPPVTVAAGPLMTMSSAGRTSTSGGFPPRAGMSTTAAITSAPAAWWSCRTLTLAGSTTAPIACSRTLRAWRRSCAPKASTGT